VNRRLTFSSITLCVAAVICLLEYFWRHSEPKRQCIAALETFQAALSSSDSSLLLKQIAVPKAVRGKTPQEQAEFVRKALRNELSAGGLRLLAARGSFGPLNQIFPDEGARWAAQAGVNPETCMAFRWDGRRFRTEVVLNAQGDAYRIVRCNNVNDFEKEKL
jgi:hypothetical protein